MNKFARCCPPKPKTFDQWRLSALIALTLDTGVRIEEALTLRTRDVDFDSLLLTVFGRRNRNRNPVPTSQLLKYRATIATAAQDVVQAHQVLRRRPSNLFERQGEPPSSESARSFIGCAEG